MATTRKKSSASTSKNNSGLNPTVLVVGLVLVIAVVAAVIVMNKNKNSDGSNAATTANSTSASSSGNSPGGASVGSGTLTVDPGSQSVSNGSVLTISLYEDSKSDAVNAVQTNLTYPADKFDLVKIDTSGSAFAIKAQEDGGSGTIKIARGTIDPVTGKQLVAKVQLKAKAGSGSASVEFANGSGIVRSSDNKEVLQTTNGGTFTLTQ